MSEQQKLIEFISERSNRYGDKLLKFMDENNLNSLRESKVEQLREFVKKEFGKKVIEK